MSATPLLEGVVIACVQLGKVISSMSSDGEQLQGEGVKLTNQRDRMSPEQQTKVLEAVTEVHGLTWKSFMKALGLNLNHRLGSAMRGKFIDPFLAWSRDEMVVNLKKAVELLR